MYRAYHMLLSKRLQYLHKLLQGFRMKRLALINKDRDFFQYNSGNLVYIISPLTSQLRTASRKTAIKYVGLLAVYMIIDPHNYLLTLSTLRGTDSSFQPVPSMTIVLFIVTALPCQVGL